MTSTGERSEPVSAPGGASAPAGRSKGDEGPSGKPVPVLREVIRAVIAVLVGAAIGLVAKFNDEHGGLQDIGTYVALWGALAAVTAFWAPSRGIAALRAALVMAAAMTTYYAYQAHLFGYFSENLYAGWLGLSLTAVPVWAFLVAGGRGTGWLAALAASAPVGLLVAEAWSTRHHFDLHGEVAIVNVAVAVLLVVVVPRTWAQRGRVVACAVPVSLVAMPVIDAVVRFVPGI